jgi:AraC-like DNA-binding protein
MADLPLKPLYTVGDLARASGMSRRRLQRILAQAGVTFLRSGTIYLVSLSELELKAAPFWEGIKAAYAIEGETR